MPSKMMYKANRTAAMKEVFGNADLVSGMAKHLPDYTAATLLTLNKEVLEGAGPRWFKDKQMEMEVMITVLSMEDKALFRTAMCLMGFEIRARWDADPDLQQLYADKKKCMLDEHEQVEKLKEGLEAKRIELMRLIDLPIKWEKKNKTTLM